MKFTLTPHGAEWHGLLTGRELEFFNRHRDDVSEFLALLLICRFCQQGGRVWLEGNRLTLVGPKAAASAAKVLRTCQTVVKRYLRLRDVLPV